MGVQNPFSSCRARRSAPPKERPSWRLPDSWMSAKGRCTGTSTEEEERESQIAHAPSVVLAVWASFPWARSAATSLVHSARRCGRVGSERLSQRLHRAGAALCCWEFKPLCRGGYPRGTPKFRAAIRAVQQLRLVGVDYYFAPGSSKNGSTKTTAPALTRTAVIELS